MRKLRVIVPATVALLATGLTLTSADAANGGTTLRLSAVTTEQRHLDLGEKGPSLGDQDVFHDKVFSHSRLVGTNDGFCTVTYLAPKAVEATSECLVTTSLQQGSLTLHGVLRFMGSTAQDATLAVSGGTGRFDGAAGEAHVKFTSETRATITVHLR